MNSKDWKKTHVVYYKDELNDDFNELDHVKKRPPVKYDYKYYRRNPFIRFLYFILYYFLAKPLVGLFCLIHGIHFKNKKNLKELHHKGAYFYSNHVSISDCFKFPAYIIFFKRVNIIGYSDASSIPVARHLVKAFGYLPIPDDIDNMVKLRDACNTLVNKRKQYVLIFPEAHIWPYYTKIRHFKNVSFTYPAESNTPVVPVVTIWRKVFYSKKPRQTVVFGKPIFPNPELTVMENKSYLAERCYEEMVKIASSFKQVEYIEYIKAEEEDKND